MVRSASQYYDGYMQEKRVVTIGGGTGHYVLLSGLKKQPVQITAVVSMADDGGSSGVLRDEMGVLPPGDVRQCLAALSDETEILRTLFNYRFGEGSVRGHSFGNLFLSALQKVTGSFPQAVKTASEVLKIHGTVIPVTHGDMRLIVELKDGTKLSGERFLDASDEVRTVGVARISLLNRVEPEADALQAIAAADVIILGPGDLYGSTLPPLLLPGIATAVKNARAPIVYVCNLTNKKGQTEGFTVDDYVRSLHQYIGAHCIDAVLCNNATPAPHLLSYYEAQEGKHMLVGCGGKEDAVYRKYSTDLLSEESPMFLPQDALAAQGSRSFIRHDPKKLGDALMRVIDEVCTDAPTTQ